MNFKKLYSKSKFLFPICACASIFLTTTVVQAQGVKMPITIGNVSGEITPKQNAADGNPATSWNSGGPAIQWIDIDLGSEKGFSRIRMLPEQAPGNTSHNVYGRTSAGVWYSLGNVTGYTTDNEWIQFDNQSSIPVRYIVIQTTESPSWVAWREFEVYEGSEYETRCTLDVYGDWAIVDVTPGGCPDYQNNRTYHYRKLTDLPQNYTVNACFYIHSTKWEYAGETPGACLGVSGNRTNWRRR